MSFQSDNGYTPISIETIMLSFMDNINLQFGSTYTAETFIGTNFYKYFYAIAQRIQENEIKTSEIFAKLTDYFALTDERISRPVVTNPGVIEKLETQGYIASIKKPIDADAGKIYIAVDVDDAASDYDDVKLEIGEIIKDSTVAGAVTQGTEVVPLTLSNGQAFDFKFNLPNRIDVKLRLTVTISENNMFVVDSPDEVKLRLLANISDRYQLGKNFEPMRYFTMQDAPWSSKVLLEWSSNGGTTWQSTIYDANYNDLFETPLENITLIED